MRRVILLVFISAFIFFSCDAGFARGKNEAPAAKGRPTRAPSQRRIPESIQQQRQKRQRRSREKLQQMREKGQNDKQETKALTGPAVKESGKHQRRLARLKRIRELAVESGNEKTVERVDKLLEKENQRFSRKMRKINEKMSRKRMKELEKENLRQQPANSTQKELHRKRVQEVVEQKKQLEKKKAENDSK